MAEHQLPKLNTRVRFPSSAPLSPARTVSGLFDHPLGRDAADVAFDYAAEQPATTTLFGLRRRRR